MVMIENNTGEEEICLTRVAPPNKRITVQEGLMLAGEKVMLMSDGARTDADTELIGGKF